MRCHNILSILIVVALSFATGEALSQKITIRGAPPSPIVDAILRNGVPQIRLLLSPNEQQRLDSINIILTDRALFGSPSAGIAPNGQRVILLNRRFLTLLYGYTHALFAATALSNPDEIEPYVYKIVSRQPPVFNGLADDLNPFNYFKHDDPQRFWDQYGSIIENATLAAITDILVHEMGHHVLDAFYDPQFASREEIRVAEASADEWASAVMNKVADDMAQLSGMPRELAQVFPSMGRFIAISFINLVENSSVGRPAAAQVGYPPHAVRVATSLPENCVSTSPEHVAVCEALRKLSKIPSSFDNKDDLLVHYTRLAEQGSLFGLFMKAKYTLHLGAEQEACQDFLRAYESGYGPESEMFLGWCYSYRPFYMGVDREVGLTLAFNHHQNAAKEGWSFSQSYLRNLPR
ncbi:MAG: hypothetical protein ROR55_17765 [Devosia sp.]